METFFPKAAILVLTAILGMMFLTGIANPYKSTQNKMSDSYKKQSCTNIKSLGLSEAEIPSICKP